MTAEQAQFLVRFMRSLPGQRSVEHPLSLPSGSQGGDASAHYDFGEDGGGGYYDDAGMMMYDAYGDGFGAGRNAAG